ncbi:GNAT family N-acetyltransferase [Oerskovia sp. Sa1BUA8]|uniref:GNAT family N-acetyltransferase n=1 Tax=Oerskovia douganii TaxID=2762210 RepID=A0A9D5UB86_9CELL|nr:GNAT family N-acetyltransferase [Oerskovia douganii]MBE7701174.1 GNAT family N-acetyltransferase [Oerskovia douganii]
MSAPTTSRRGTGDPTDPQEASHRAGRVRAVADGVAHLVEAARREGRAGGPPGVGRAAPDAAVTVRLVTPAEHEAVADLLEAAYGHEYSISESYRTVLRDVASRAAEHDVWVAVDDGTGEVLGTVATPLPGRHISPLALDGELDFRLLGVAPAARGRGIGTTLTLHVLDVARAQGAQRVVMSSGPQMVRAHRLYEALGFQRLPERETRVIEGEGGGRLHAYGLDLAGAAPPGPSSP